MSIDWNWGIFLQEAPFGNTTYLGWLWSGFEVTVALSITARIIAFLIGSLFGILRTVPNRFLSGIGTLYVELFRNVPLIVQFLHGIWLSRNCSQKTLACGSRLSWIPTSSFPLLNALPGAVYRRPRL